VNDEDYKPPFPLTAKLNKLTIKVDRPKLTAEDEERLTEAAMKEHSTPVTFPEDETFDIGQDTRTGLALVEYRYDVPFKFTGKINKLTFKLEPEQTRKAER